MDLTQIDADLAVLQGQLTDVRRMLREEENRGDRVTLMGQSRRLSERIEQLTQERINLVRLHTSSQPQ